MSEVGIINKAGESGSIGINVARSKRTIDGIISMQNVQTMVQTNLISPKCKVCTASFTTSDTVVDVETPDADSSTLLVESGIPKIVVIPYITSDQPEFPSSITVALFDENAADINSYPQYIGSGESVKKWHEAGSTCFYEPIFIENIFMSTLFSVKAALAAVPSSALDIKFSIFVGEDAVYVTPVDNSFMLINPETGDSAVIERHDLTISDLGTYTVSGGSLVFPGGTQGYFSVGDEGDFNFLYDGTSPYTLEFFMNPIWANDDRIMWVGNGAYGFLLDINYSTGEGTEYGIHITMNRAADDPIFVGAYSSLGSWSGEKHVAITLDPSGSTNSLSVFFDGVLEDQFDRYAGFIVTSGTEKLVIGGLATYTEAFEGSMRGIRITKEILYTENFTPPTEF